MVKPFLALALAGTGLLLALQAEAQYYYVPYVTAGHNPGSLNNDTEGPLGSTLSPGWAALLNSTTVTTPTWSAVQTLPFSFSLNGQAFTQYIVSSTGVLTFSLAAASGTVPGTTNVALPAVDIPDNSVCLWGLTMRAPSAANFGDFVISKTFGAAPHRQHWVQFNSCSDAGTPGNVYWSIVLEESTNTVYLVDQRATAACSLTGGIQLDATSAVQVAASPNLTSTTISTASAGTDDNTYYAFRQGQRQAYDLAMESFSPEPVMWFHAAPFTFSGKVRNEGSQSITGFNVAYSVNGGPAVSSPVSGTVASSQARVWTSTMPWQPAAPGRYVVRAWTSAPGGQPDGNAANDTLTRVVYVSDVAVQRTVLEEAFTSSTCPPCNPGNVVVANVTQANPGKATQIKYQQNYPAPGNDPYYTAESGARHNYYNLSSIPTLMLDGGWGSNSNSFTTQILDQYRARPAFMAVDVVYSIDPVAQSVSAQAQILPLADVPSDQLAAFLVITEKHTRNNARTNGETDFYHVMKKMLPDETGTLLQPMQRMQMQTVQQTYTFPANNNVEHFDSLEVAFFVQDRLSKQVYQSMPARFNGTLGAQPSVQPLGIADEPALAAGFCVYPNPVGRQQATLALELAAPALVTVDVLDALGRRVAGRVPEMLPAGGHQLPLQLRGLTAGLYVVQLTHDGQTRSLRLAVE